MNIVILGGGFGGVRCALDLDKKFKGTAKITLIDRRNYHLFTPTLYEVASAFGMDEDPFSLKLRKTISISYDQIFEGKRVNVVEAEIAQVDLQNRIIATGGGEQIPFDYCVLALGSQASDFGIPGVKDYAHQFKTVEDGLMLNQKIKSLFADAKNGLVSLPITFLVGGAGFTGIELAAELACCARNMGELYGLRGKSFSVALFEAAPKILPMVSEKERLMVRRRLTELGIAIMEQSEIEEISADAVKLKNGHTVKGHAVVWTAGVKPNEFLQTISDLPLTEKKKVIVETTLQVARHPQIFAIGDCIEFIDPTTQKPMPGFAYTATKQGSLVASNIYANIKQKKLRSYFPNYEQWIAPIGGKFAVAHISNSTTLTGFWGWVARNIADLRYISSILPLSKALALFRKDLMIFSHND
ncbi:NAD(P)/FAD-dependent oxidoreductase [Candidatus Parcubacteria bacterium]|nr:NAD(P)/FAD-dependent oxidoreductase [Candidatus Parcubacteria bacterium]